MAERLRRNARRGLRLTLGLAVTFSLTACDPIAGIPGGRLSGTVAPPPTDWSFSDAVDTFQLETRPDDPYSINLWGVAHGEHFYIATSSDTTWFEYISEDPRVRLRVDDTVYDLRAEPATNVPDRDAFWAAVERKYEYAPDADQRESGSFFRLVPR